MLHENIELPTFHSRLFGKIRRVVASGVASGATNGTLCYPKAKIVAVYTPRDASGRLASFGG